MASQFTASAYVRIIDKVKRQDVCETLDSLGYNEICSGSVDYNYVIIIHGDYAVDYKGSVGRDVFNCSDDISLFLELAQMRSNTDKGQWFVCISKHITPHLDLYQIGDMIKCTGDKARISKIHPSWRRATPQEVYEHLKKR